MYQKNAMSPAIVDDGQNGRGKEHDVKENVKERQLTDRKKREMEGKEGRRYQGNAEAVGKVMRDSLMLCP
ncbi:hypothetical protein Dda_0923 [Drechslerella dactyloides]|uniref:Uncharacterized protein n=1 Tax=Drechslerella dactyloides TaxID=74499 RepID=A0AAD6J639_DREDA|nr:hypothetical protein Dda_0923 [Drechslerella dactyloides]